jgi:Mrp family chromosome partitioning ATPase
MKPPRTKVDDVDISPAETADPSAVDPRIVALLDPWSAAGEQYRMLALRIERQARSRGLRKVFFTSAVGGEGKTTVAINAAIALASVTELRVALVDAHLGRPAVHRSLGLGAEVGLAQVCSGAIDLDQALWQLNGGRLSVLPAGSTGALGCPPAAIAEALAGMSERFELTVVDGPPLLTSADASLIADAVDAIALVIRARRTPRHLVELAIEAVEARPILGAVVNDVSGASGGFYGRLLASPPANRAVVSQVNANRLLEPKRAA